MVLKFFCLFLPPPLRFVALIFYYLFSWCGLDSALFSSYLNTALKVLVENPTRGGRVKATDKAQ